MFADLSIDFETTGTDPVDNAIIQIGAIRFNYETGEIGPSFEVCLTVPPTKYWCQNTLEWWGKQGGVLDSILARAIHYREGFKAFQQWLLDTSPALSVPQRLWAKPTHFEWPMLQRYSREYEMELPLHYRDAIDLNSFCRGLANDPGAVPLDWQIQFEGNMHDALDDAAHQIKVALLARSMIHA